VVIRRLLIANRGEIAIRVINACRELGIESVAVHSDADAAAPHVVAADRAVRIGPAPARESYLDAARLIDAARASGADAIHPGYGFLSENAAFAGACTAAGIVFVGPPAAVIARMGSKIEARRLMSAADVPVVPGGMPGDQSDGGVRRTVSEVGLPAVIKASAGGGGKGMRAVHTAAEIDQAIQAARREAIAAFGDGTLYVERLIAAPRHIEVQILADNHGHVVHLFERECSVQRRHQKVIEESPSVAIAPALRARMTQAAVDAARAADYRNAGTVEFLVDAGAPGTAASFFFLEMNTRLQVEHPVTEAVTGLDLVRAQLLVAAGEPLPWTQDRIEQRGHAIEARLYAEDPASGFLPQAGPLILYREPRAPGLRIDSGVVEGGEVSIHYDPLMAKVIAHAETRDLAISRLASALRRFPVLGVRTNVEYLLRVLDHADFQSGSIDTEFLERHGAALAEAPGGAPEFVRAAANSHPNAAGSAGDARRNWDPWQQ
jgi:acetyl/propionyl-CoA carboxylase alpha subunit